MASCGTESNGDRIGDVGRVRHLTKAALRLHRDLHLPLARVPVACDRLLDLSRAEFLQLNVALLGGQENHPARVPHFDRRRGMGVVGVQLLDRHALRFQLIENRAKVGEQLDQTLSHGLAGSQSDHSSFDKFWFLSIGGDVHAAVAGQPQSGVDADDPHALLGYGRRLRIARSGRQLIRQNPAAAQDLI